jgi:O-antigen/teichoic acid export membrane protein
MVIATTHGKEALGKYSVALSLGLALTVLTNGLLQVFSPWILRKIRKGKLEIIKKYVGLGARGIMLSALLMLAAAPELIALITPTAYHDALPAVYPLALTTIAMFISGAAMAGEMYYEKNTLSSLPTIFVSALSVLAAILILPRLDYRAAGVFALGAYLVLALLNSLGFRRLSGESLVGMRECIGIYSLGIVYALLLYLLRGVFISRILLSLAILPILFNTGRQVLAGIKERAS